MANRDGVAATGPRFAYTSLRRTDGFLPNLRAAKGSDQSSMFPFISLYTRLGGGGCNMGAFLHGRWRDNTLSSVMAALHDLYVLFHESRCLLKSSVSSYHVPIVI